MRTDTAEPAPTGAGLKPVADDATDRRQNEHDDSALREGERLTPGDEDHEDASRTEARCGPRLGVAESHMRSAGHGRRSQIDSRARVMDLGVP